MLGDLDSESAGLLKTESSSGDDRSSSARAVITRMMTFALVTAVVGLPLLSGRVLAGHDIVNYLVHAQQTAENLRQGLIFPSWGGGYNSGFGSPVLLFFPPLTSYLGALPVLAGMPVIVGVGWLALVAHCCSGLVVFGWLRSCGHGASALPAAIVYMIAPYRLVNLYLRSALAEHWAFVWPPLILWIAGSKKLRPLERTLLTAVAVAGLLVTNIPLAVLFGIGLAVWFVISGRVRGHRIQVLWGVGLGFGLAAFFLVPVVGAASLLDLGACFGVDAGRFRPSANTLFVGGLFDRSPKAVFSWAVVATFVLALGSWALLGRRLRTSRAAQQPMIAAIICVAATTVPVGPIWDGTPILSSLQFPWRVTAVLTFALVGLVACLPVRRAWSLVLLTAAVAIPFSSWDRCLPKATFYSEKPTTRIQPGTVFPDPFAAWEAGSGGWYWRHHNLVELCLLPRSMPRSLLSDLAGSRRTEFDEIRGRPAVLREDPRMRLEVTSWDQAHRSMKVDSPVDGTLIWRVLWFPEMHVSVDGTEVPLLVDSSTGLVAHALPFGSHRVDWRWRPYSALRWARGLSIAAFLVLGCFGSGAIALRASKWAKVRDNHETTRADRKDVR